MCIERVSIRGVFVRKRRHADGVRVPLLLEENREIFVLNAPQPNVDRHPIFVPLSRGISRGFFGVAMGAP